MDSDRRFNEFGIQTSYYVVNKNGSNEVKQNYSRETEFEKIVKIIMIDVRWNRDPDQVGKYIIDIN